MTLGGDVDVWRVSPWQLVGRLPSIAGRVDPSSPPPIAISQDGRLVGITAGPSTSIWDVARGHRLASRSQNSGGSGDNLIISQDGRLVASSADPNTEIWERHTGRLIATLRSGTNSVRPAAFSRDDTRVVTVSDDKTARIWDARSGKPIAVLRGHTDTVTSAALSADDRFVATASWDGTVRVWDADSGRAVATLPVRATTDTSVAFSATATPWSWPGTASSTLSPARSAAPLANSWILQSGAHSARSRRKNGVISYIPETSESTDEAPLPVRATRTRGPPGPLSGCLPT